MAGFRANLPNGGICRPLRQSLFSGDRAIPLRGENRYLPRPASPHQALVDSPIGGGGNPSPMRGMIIVGTTFALPTIVPTTNHRPTPTH
jgi:hypothetical protein